MYGDTSYEVAQERMQEQMRRAAIWRTQRAAMDARRKRVEGAQDKLEASRRNYYLESLFPNLLSRWVQRMGQLRSFLFFW